MIERVARSDSGRSGAADRPLDYTQGRQRFAEMRATPSCAEILAKMARLGLPEYKVALLYFGEGRLFIDDVARLTGYEVRQVQRWLLRFKQWMNTGGLVDGVDQVEVKRMLDNLKNLEEADFLSNQLLPPVTLRLSRHSIWQKLQQFVDSENQVNFLRKIDPVEADLVARYYQLGEYVGYDVTLEELAAMTHVQHQAMSKRLKKALKALGIRDEVESVPF